MTAIGDRLVLEVGDVAHGGHCVARDKDQVVFVRHALPGEQVEVVVTSKGPKGRYLFADVHKVLTASPDRREAPCAHAGVCGGCDWQHVELAAQRELKARVLREQLHRLGGLTEVGGAPLEESVQVAAVAGDHEGLGWRTRVRYAVDNNGRAGFRRHGSHLVEPVESCPLVSQGVDSAEVTRRTWLGVDDITVVASSTGEVAVLPSPMVRTLPSLPSSVTVPGLRGRKWVRESAGGRDWRVGVEGFWQVHPGAADALIDEVRAVLAPQPGEHLLDLYCGVGLFAGSLAADVGDTGRIDAVETSVQACGDARRNMHDLPHVHIHEASVDLWLTEHIVTGADLVVLDPPRSGAGRKVMESLLDMAPRVIAYVSCDPASLGRDIGYAREAGWTVASVRGFDLFPMTHHLEAVAALVPPARG